MSLQSPHLTQHKNKEAKDGTDLKRQADHLTAQNVCISKSYDLPNHYVWFRIYLDCFYKEAKKESLFQFQFWE